PAASTLAQKAPAYGFDGVRVDGMDALAVYRTTRDAAGRAREGQGPTMIEAVTYRLGPHSSSDDPARYRDEAEVATWRARDPIARFRRHLEHAGWWDDARAARLEQEIGDEITHAIQEAERAGPPGDDTLCTDVDGDACALGAACLGAEGDYAEAARVDRLMTEADPENPQGWNSLGYDLFHAGDLEEALEAFERAVELEPTRASTYFNLARIAAR